MKNDEEEEQIVNSAGVSRYQCMPSEVALQQMRNRMQLAKLGKKLMKWTALASSRELRALGQELKEAYDELHAKLHDAYILLARSRYFNPNLNNIVTENVENHASVLVESRLRQKSGVKVMLQEVKETDYIPYTYLGIEKGGEIIMEAKKQWHEIITMLIIIMQLRTTFRAVDKANKAANKKKNVFSRIIIPRTMETIAYIESGLEELAREDFFRLRRFIYKKRSTTPSYQERKPMEIKERLLPKPSKRVFKIECFMCGAFLRFSLVDEREKYLERRKIQELRFQMNEMLQIAKKLEEQGIVGHNVDEFIMTAEKIKDRLNESPHLDQLCRKCKELLKKKQEKENKDQELQQREQDKKIETFALRPESAIPMIGIPKEGLVTPVQDLNTEGIGKNYQSLEEPEQSNKVNDTFTEIYRDTNEDFIRLKGRSMESTKKEISTITITKELKSEPSVSLSQTSIDSPMETSIEKIKKVVTDEKENKLVVEEKFIITIKEKIKNVIGKMKRPPKSSETPLDEENNQSTHEMIKSTIIRIESRLSNEPMSSESRERDLRIHSGLALEDRKSEESMHRVISTVLNDQIVNDLPQSNKKNPDKLSSSKQGQGALKLKSPKANDEKNNYLSTSSPKYKITETTQGEAKDETSEKSSPRSTSFTDDLKNETIRRSKSLPNLHLSNDELQEKVAHMSESKTNKMKLNASVSHGGVTIREVSAESITESMQLNTKGNAGNLNISSEPKVNENEKKVHTTYNIQVKQDEHDKLNTSMGTSKSQAPERRVQIKDVRCCSSVPGVSETSNANLRGSISYAGTSGVYIPPQNPTEIVTGPCICVSSTTLLSTELDTNKD